MWISEKGIASFKIYQDMFPVVEKVLLTLSDCESKCVASSAFLVEDTKKTTIEILSYIASGYNNYDTNFKATEYNKARNAISMTQSNLILLNNNKLLSEENLNENYNALEDKLKMISGVLRKIEKR
ncbi:MAG: four helix bundle protein [archaeon]